MIGADLQRQITPGGLMGVVSDARVSWLYPWLKWVVPALGRVWMVQQVRIEQRM